MDYFVFRDRRSEGPFSEEDLIGFVREGRYTPGDLGRPEDARHWTPLRNLFPTLEDGSPAPSENIATAGASEVPPIPLGIPLPTAETLPPAAEPEEKTQHYRQMASNVGHQIRSAFDRNPLETGVLCLVIGCVLAVLSFFPEILFGPWLLAALIAGGMLLLRDRLAAGLGLCAAAVFLPILLRLVVAHLIGRT